MVEFGRNTHTSLERQLLGRCSLKIQMNKQMKDFIFMGNILEMGLCYSLSYFFFSETLGKIVVEVLLSRLS